MTYDDEFGIRLDPCEHPSIYGGVCEVCGAHDVGTATEDGESGLLPRQVGWWHTAKGCNHFARTVGAECFRTDGRWEPVCIVAPRPKIPLMEGVGGFAAPLSEGDDDLSRPDGDDR